jgi:hypothetical protein
MPWNEYTIASNSSARSNRWLELLLPHIRLALGDKLTTDKARAHGDTLQRAVNRVAHGCAALRGRAIEPRADRPRPVALGAALSKETKRERANADRRTVMKLYVVQ